MVGCSDLDITPFDLKECVFWTDSTWYLKVWKGKPQTWDIEDTFFLENSRAHMEKVMCCKEFKQHACTLRKNHLGGCVSYTPESLNVAPGAFVL